MPAGPAPNPVTQKTGLRAFPPVRGAFAFHVRAVLRIQRTWRLYARADRDRLRTPSQGGDRMRNFRRAVGALLLTGGLLVTGATGQALAAQPSLNGEVLIAGPDAGAPSDTSMYEVTLRCGGTPPSQWNYTASGPASGPYPGPFTETGSVTIDANGLGDSAPVLTLHSDFAIQ